MDTSHTHTHAHSQQLSESLEDYLEAILHIIDDNGVAYPRDIAKALKVSNASVTGALRALSERELINYAPYMPVTMTATGEAHAREITQRHETLSSFLRDFLEVDPKLADETACKMEHILSQEIVQKFAHLAQFMRSHPSMKKEWFQPGNGEE
ncbi:MAG: metal-dependent transcriptional regulator [Planctomycetia bacterium]|nr:metal-dependent transcriptional regulator [Planctomycetia bacterium]